MTRAVVIYAHPYPDRSRANRILIDAVRTLDDVTVRPLYDLYPDFAIDEVRERELLTAARTSSCGNTRCSGTRCRRS